MNTPESDMEQANLRESGYERTLQRRWQSMRKS